ncbi:Lrp/AsnC family transcriptional regulator [Promethearchaeum syntrophicum]|uniref:Lrp/AsnC family transcriptional regulator n=1 Tax=Promethearchaeum syntrophicum TaxID=2594042 RepID=A0A5B9DCS3_9ARCH|nr:Lrp/AsnC ligand binding domain-containing protein [Candidatus Prometheoarchaeum syntrophicum]QEE16687.1 AsnC family protein [Candidatus Prometheoarchaeum syntrophicum]
MSSDENIVAYILLITDSVNTEEIYKKLKSIEQVKEVHMIYGDYDIIFKVEVKNLAELSTFTMDIRKNFNIKSSSTLITLAQK